MQQILKYTTAPGKSFPLQSLFQGSEHKHYHSISVTNNKPVYILGNIPKHKGSEWLGSQISVNDNDYILFEISF